MTRYSLAFGLAVLGAPSAFGTVAAPVPRLMEWKVPAAPKAARQHDGGSYIEISASLHLEVAMRLEEGKGKGLFPPCYGADAYVVDAARRALGLPPYGLAAALALCPPEVRERVQQARLAAKMAPVPKVPHGG